MLKASAAPEPYACNLADVQASEPDWIGEQRACDLLPVEICAACALLIVDHIQNGLTGSVTFGITEALRRQALPAPPSCVYYVRRRDRIKIGTTRDFPARMVALLPDEILAVEPGDRDLEQTLHGLFGHLRVTGEWFRDDPTLRTHIAAVIAKHGAPPTASVF